MIITHAATQGPIFIPGLSEEVARTARDRQALPGKKESWEIGTFCGRFCGFGL
jgi:hypothetical protein